MSEPVESTLLVLLLWQHGNTNSFWLFARRGQLQFGSGPNGIVLTGLPVPFAHILCMRRVDVLDHDLLPPSPAQPSTEEALHLLDLTYLLTFIAIVGDVVGFAAWRQAPFTFQRAQLQKGNGRGEERKRKKGKHWIPLQYVSHPVAPTHTRAPQSIQSRECKLNIDCFYRYISKSFEPGLIRFDPTGPIAMNTNHHYVVYGRNQVSNGINFRESFKLSPSSFFL